MASSSSWERGGQKNKKPGRGHIERKKVQRAADYEARHPEPEKQYDLEGNTPTVLSPNNVRDCAFAKKFAEGVEREVAALRRKQLQYGRDDADDGFSAHYSSYSFFNKSTLLVETMSPKKEGTPHLTTMFGVAGCGKTVHLVTNSKWHTYVYIQHIVYMI